MRHQANRVCKALSDVLKILMWSNGNLSKKISFYYVYGERNSYDLLSTVKLFLKHYFFSCHNMVGILLTRRKKHKAIIEKSLYLCLQIIFTYPILYGINGEIIDIQFRLNTFYNVMWFFSMCMDTINFHFSIISCSV